MRSLKHAAVFALTLAMAMPGMLLASGSSDLTKSRKEAVDLTRSVERTSREIQRVTDDLASKSRNMHYSNQSHQQSLHQLKIHINEKLQPALTRLAELQPDLPAWHQEAIDQMRTSAATLTANANAAIVTRNPGQTRLVPVLDTEYKQLIDNMSSRASVLTQVADATGDYGSARPTERQSRRPGHHFPRLMPRI